MYNITSEICRCSVSWVEAITNGKLIAVQHIYLNSFVSVVPIASRSQNKFMCGFELARQPLWLWMKRIAHCCNLDCNYQDKRTKWINDEYIDTITELTELELIGQCAEVERLGCWNTARNSWWNKSKLESRAQGSDLVNVLNVHWTDISVSLTS